MKKSYFIDMVDECHSKRIKLWKSIVREYGIDWDGNALLYFYLFDFWQSVQAFINFTLPASMGLGACAKNHKAK